MIFVKNNKQKTMWKTIQFFLFCKINLTFARLAGDHVCLTKETYPVNVTEWYERNATVRNYRWCYNVPPRCSYYTLKRINETRIVEKNETTTVEKCCPGFLEKENHCVSSCPSCQNGVCENGTCRCLSGYKGLSCELDCPPGEWGPNCARSCNCPNKCDPKTGICSEQTTTKPTTLATIEKTVPTSPSTTTKEEQTVKIATPTTTLTEKPTKTTTKSPISTIKEQFTTTTKSSSATIIEEQTRTTTKSSSSTIEQTGATTKPSSSTIKEDQTGTTTKPSSSTIKEDQTGTTTKSYENATKEDQPNKNLTPIVTKQGLLIPVEIQYELKHKPTTYSTVQDKNYLQTSNEEYSNRQMSKNNLSANEFALFGITVLLALMLTVAVLSVNFLRKKKRKNSQNGKRHLSVFSASIFHSPLPDPPVTENPLYMNPVKCQGDKELLPAFETRIICNVNNTPNANEIEYDHPPSIVNVKSAPLADAVLTRPGEDCSIEPVYDEIPQKDIGEQEMSSSNTSYSGPMSIYINTCGRTKF